MHCDEGWNSCKGRRDCVDSFPLLLSDCACSHAMPRFCRDAHGSIGKARQSDGTGEQLSNPPVRSSYSIRSASTGLMEAARRYPKQQVKIGLVFILHLPHTATAWRKTKILF